MFLRVFSIHVLRQDSTIFFHKQELPQFLCNDCELYNLSILYRSQTYCPKSFSNSSNLIPFQVRRFKKLMRKAKGGSCLDHIVPSSQIEALNTTYQSGKCFDCILGVYAYTPFSMFTTFVFLRKFLKQDKLYRVWT